MNSLINIKETVGLVLTLSLAGGGLVMLFDVFATTSAMKTVTVHELLRDQNPGQISYISFPINEHTQHQLASHRNSIPFPGGRYSFQER